MFFYFVDLANSNILTAAIIYIATIRSLSFLVFLHPALQLLGNTTLFAIPENYALAINTKTSYSAFRSLSADLNSKRENYALAINTKTSYAAFRSPVLLSSVWVMKLLSEATNFSFTELWLLPTEIQRFLEIRTRKFFANYLQINVPYAQQHKVRIMAVVTSLTVV